VKEETASAIRSSSVAEEEGTPKEEQRDGHEESKPPHREVCYDLEPSTRSSLENSGSSTAMAVA